MPVRNDAPLSNLTPGSNTIEILRGGLHEDAADQSGADYSVGWARRRW